MVLRSMVWSNFPLFVVLWAISCKTLVSRVAQHQLLLFTLGDLNLKVATDLKEAFSLLL